MNAQPHVVQQQTGKSINTMNTAQDPRWQAVINKDASFAGQFVYAVTTTGVYCHPGSRARIPKPEHVIFFDTPQQAEQAGYRPSLRQGSQQADLQTEHRALIAKACRWIEQAEQQPRLAQLAEAVGLSQFHFQRLFKQHVGLSPKQYALALRAGKFREQLLADQQAGITNAIYNAGFNSSSRFYQKSQQVLGMTASEYKQGGQAKQIRFALGQCSLGAIIVAQSERGICWVALDDDPAVLLKEFQDHFHQAELIGADAAFEQLIARVVAFIEAPEIGLQLPLDIQGTAFQQRVWQALQTIPVGHTMTYADIAERIGSPKSVRAVANACAANKLAVAIPCHRVIRQDGSLSGYRWGVARKQQLLQREQEV